MGLNTKKRYSVLKVNLYKNGHDNTETYIDYRKVIY